MRKSDEENRSKDNKNDGEEHGEAPEQQSPTLSVFFLLC